MNLLLFSFPSYFPNLNLLVPSQLYEERESLSQDISTAINQYREYEKSLGTAISHVNGIMPA